MKDQIDDNIKDERRDLLLQYQSEISNELLSKRIGKTYQVLIEDYQDGYYFGRSQHFTAEIDGEIQIESDAELIIGEFYDIEITGSLMY